MVTTPQEASLQVTRRGISLFKKLNIPIIGLVENMSCVICPQCSTEVSLSNNRTSKLAEELGENDFKKVFFKRMKSIKT